MDDGASNAGVTIVFIVLAGIVLAGLVFPPWLSFPRIRRALGRPALTKEESVAHEEARRTWAEAIGGAALAIGLVITWQQIQDTRSVSVLTLESQQALQADERFVQATELLASNARNSQIGGIYILDQLARDPEQAERYYWPVMNVLAAFVRQTTPMPPVGAGNAEDQARRAATDAALWVIAHRTRPPNDQMDRALNLSFVDLSGASLEGANLAHVDFTRSTFLGTTLDGADLTGADLSLSVLRRDGNQTPATLVGACLAGANLDGAAVWEGQLAEAQIDEDTVLPSDLGATPVPQECIDSGANATVASEGN
jgi:hypothetical protein